MIIDNLTNLANYASLNKHLPKVIEFLSNHDLHAMAEGRYEVCGSDVFLTIQEGALRTLGDAPIEYHQKMIDLQIPLSRNEAYGYADVTAASAPDFDDANDIGFLPKQPADGVVTCRPGMFAIFFPQDGHAPMMGNPNEVIRKAIFKIKA